MKLRLATCLVALALSWVALPSAPARAEDTRESQLRLNNEAAQAVAEGDLERAILLLRSALELGELNVTWLNLGRTYARAGQCDAAADAYSHVPVSPAVEAPPAAEVSALAERYARDLHASCYAAVTFDCRPPTLELTLDDGEPMACPERAVALEPGRHQVVARLGEQRVETRLEVGTAERARVTVVMPERGASGDATVDVTSLDGAARPLLWSGVGTLGAGVAMLATAAVIDQTLLGDDIDALEQLARSGDEARFASKKDDVDALQDINLGLFIGGGLVAAAGAALVVADLVLHGGSERAAMPTAGVSADGVELGWRWTF